MNVGEARKLVGQKVGVHPNDSLVHPRRRDLTSVATAVPGTLVSIEREKINNGYRGPKTVNVCTVDIDDTDQIQGRRIRIQPPSLYGPWALVQEAKDRDRAKREAHLDLRDRANTAAARLGGASLHFGSQPCVRLSIDQAERLVALLDPPTSSEGTT